MSKRKVLGLALGASLLFGLQQMAVADPVAEQESRAEAPAAQAGPVKAAYYERHATARRGNIYGSQGVIGHTNVPRRGYYGAAASPRHYHAHRYYAPRPYYAPRTIFGTGTVATAAPAPVYYSNSTGYAPYRYNNPRTIFQTGAATAPATAYYPNPAGGYVPYNYYAPRTAVATGATVAAPGGQVFYSDPISAFNGTTSAGSRCVGGRTCVGGYHYRGGVPVCRSWAACN